MALAFDDRKLLPPGVHEATIEQADELLGRFQRSDRRIKLFARLKAYLEQVKRAIGPCAVIIDGSFVMGSVDEPDDVDLLLLLPPEWNLDAELKPQQYNLVSTRDAKREFGVEIFAVRAGSPKADRLVSFFSGISPRWRELFGWPETMTKSLLRISL
jgi:hypothetical protein